VLGADADVVIAEACELVVDVSEDAGPSSEFIRDFGKLFEKDCNTCERR
jgi:hypothetical protein